MPTSIKSEAETSSIFFWGVFGIVVAEILWGCDSWYNVIITLVVEKIGMAI